MPPAPVTVVVSVKGTPGTVAVTVNCPVLPPTATGVSCVNSGHVEGKAVQAATIAAATRSLVLVVAVTATERTLSPICTLHTSPVCSFPTVRVATWAMGEASPFQICVAMIVQPFV